jgi:hypothetical protein
MPRKMRVPFMVDLLRVISSALIEIGDNSAVKSEALKAALRDRDSLEQVREQDRASIVHRPRKVITTDYSQAAIESLPMESLLAERYNNPEGCSE